MTPRSLEDIIADYTPEETFPVELPEGDKFTFKALGTHEAVRNHQKAVAAWYQEIPNPMPADHPWYGIAPTSVEDAYNVFTISELSVSPKITQYQAMKMLRAPGLVEYFSDQIESGLKTVRSRMLMKSIEKSKKNSERTTSEDQS